jgi:hypothetical protein
MDPFGINKPTQTIPQQTFKAGTPGFSVMGDLPAPTPVPKGVTQEFTTGVRNELLRANPQQRMQMTQDGGLKGRVAQSLLESEPATFRKREDAIQETPLAAQIGMDIRSGVQNPVARGVIGGLAGLGQVLPGAIEAGADLVGADGVARMASGAAQVGRDISEPLRPAGGNERLAFDIFNSITQSAPTLLVGLAGGPAMTTLFAQSGAQQYSEGRSRGLSGSDAAMRAGIQAGAEVLGERFGFGEQIKILRGLAAGLPADQLAPVLARQIVKEIPGEQLTTLIQFLGDRYGPGALNPEGTLAQYLSQAGETLKVTIGQAGVMSGGPTVIAGARDTMRRQEADQLKSATDALPASTLAARAPAPGPLPVSERIEPTMDGLLDDLIPTEAVNAIALQAPAIPAVGQAPDAPGPQGVPDGPAVAAAQPDPVAAPAEPEPQTALTPPVGNDGQQPAATPTGDVPETDFGNTQRVSTVTGRQVETRMRVVDASELQAASGELQPRDRSRASSDEQINAIGTLLADLSARTQQLRGYL